MSNPDDKEPPDEPKTVFFPAGTPSLAGAGQAPAEPMSASRANEGRIQIGDVLNHIFEVKRFIARGGMGEVYEGVNVNSDERVAIKVVLPALAADPKVQAMFRKEAKTLTRLSHPALTRYRVLAQEPRLGTLYIVTDYIDGSNLADALGTIAANTDDLVGLLRRLADGLRAAHDLGAVHRDIAPDNVLLEDGRLSGATIIDFGIAKDLDPSKGTIVGDGFAGKLNYVAPEQLGDFGREIGPWSDVYSLALVILAVAAGRNVDMGATLVEAVDRRRAGVDMSAAPERLRPLLEAMLRPNPRDRLRSMGDVLAALDDPPRAAAGPEEAPKAHVATTPRTVFAPALAPGKPDRQPVKPDWRRWVLFGGSAVIALLVLWGIGSALMEGEEKSAPPASPAEPPNRVRPLTYADVSAMLPGIGCSWLDLRGVSFANGVVSVKLSGVAGNTVAAQSTLSSVIAARGYKNANIDLEDVAPIKPIACTMLDAYRSLKAPSGEGLASDQVKYEMDLMKDGGFKGQVGAIVPVHIQRELLTRDIVLVGIEFDGSMTAASKEDMAYVKNLKPEADGSIKIPAQLTTQGWSGTLVVSGQGPIDPKLIAPKPAERDAAWKAKLAETARAKGWRADMVWFKVVDEVPNATQ
jgi:serine/threonine-protein kinase